MELIDMDYEFAYAYRTNEGIEETSDTYRRYAERTFEELVEMLAEEFATISNLAEAYADVLLRTGEPVDEDIERMLRHGCTDGYFERPKWKELMRRKYA